MERLTLDKLPKRVLESLDLEYAFIASRLVIAAERLQLFRHLAGKTLTAEEIGAKIGAKPPYLVCFLDSLVGLGLLGKKTGLYSLSQRGERYFVCGRPLQWTRRFSAECVEHFGELAVLEEMLTTGREPTHILRKQPPSYLDLMRGNPQIAEDFTRMLYYYHQPDANCLADRLNLRGFRRVLDVGGGSGVMSMALLRKNAQLRATVLDIDVVCRVAQKIIEEEGLTERMDTIIGDKNKPLPRGYDVILFCDIGPVPERVLTNAQQSLPPGGLVVLVDQYLTENRTWPLERLLRHLTDTGFGLQTRQEIKKSLRKCGFQKLLSRRVVGDVWLLAGRK